MSDLEIHPRMTDLLFLGIDGGGTKCRARLRNAQGDLLGEGTGGPSNIRLDPDLVWNSILTACREALSQAGLQENDLGRIHAGMGAAGAGQTSAVERLLARSHPFASFEIDTDAHTAWLGAFNGGDGAILIVGTGSCGYGGVSGQCHYVGGWGYEVSDEGSGAAIGRELLRRCIWAHDGRAPSTPLSDVVLAEFKNDLEILVDWVGKARPSDFGRYAPLVLDYAERRDPLAIDLVADAAAGLGLIATRLLDLGAPAICLFGGLAEPMRRWLPPPVQRTIVAPMADAVDGAILLARMAVTGRPT
ncbi:BadF/BadG/BcrA/BcrD ATPase family protein [Microvirga arabica]|uniref:BadF/BadG/BcrA/BcrD ATPase family protein n=1 Tax=Microvirga arabica TaxID=1128671 RepID=UPI001FE2F700|nr:BadF/BadG/BcrA/BcrD ATPase family protein [Microvirga arabica]